MLDLLTNVVRPDYGRGRFFITCTLYVETQWVRESFEILLRPQLNTTNERGPLVYLVIGLRGLDNPPWTFYTELSGLCLQELKTTYNLSKTLETFDPYYGLRITDPELGS